MENNELEEMRAQLATLNEKLNTEAIVSDIMLGNATKKRVSTMHKKLLVRIITITILMPIIVFKFLGLYFLPWCLGIIILNLYIYLKSRKMNSRPMSIAEYATQVHKMIKTYRKWRIVLGIFFLSAMLILGIGFLLYYWPTEKGVMMFFAYLLIDIFFASLYFVIDEIFVNPDVEITLKGVLEDLGKDNQGA